MPSRLVIRPPHAPEQPYEYVIVDDDNNIVQDTTKCLISDLPNIAVNKLVIVLIPSNQVTLTQVKMPVTSRVKLLKAIPYALEEQITMDIADLHFAIGETKPNTPIPICIVSKASMEQWTQPFIQHLIHIDIMLPEILTLPRLKNAWSIKLDENFAYVRSEDCQGFAVDINNLKILLELSLHESTELTQQFDIYHYDDNFQLDIDDNSPLNQISINTHKQTENDLVFFAKNIASNPCMNLMQGDYQTNRQINKIKKIWFIAAGITALWLLITFSSHIAQFIYWQHQNTVIENKITTLYKQLFPQSTSVVEPKVRIQRKIKQFQSMQSGGEFLSLLGTVGATIHSMSNKQLQLKNMSFINNQLSLELQADNFAIIQQLMRELAAKNLLVNQDNATSKDNVVHAKITISKLKNSEQ